MNWLNPSVALNNLQQFLEMGGDVLLIIMVATFFMWAFILERLAYYQFAHGKVAQRAFNIWSARDDHKSWTAHMVREQLISEVRQKTDVFGQNLGGNCAVVRVVGNGNWHDRGVRCDGSYRL